MTAQNVSCCSSRFRKLTGFLLVAGALLIPTQTASAQQYVMPPQQSYPAYGPSGSAVAGQVDYDGRGMGVLWRAGHSTGETVGRDESVSFITGTPFITFGESLFFGDARIVRANDGGIAWSFGSGLRHYFADVDAVLGLNAYIDNDDTIDSFQAWGVGAEVLSHNWEWRGNYYRPFGDQRAEISAVSVDGSTRFSGSDILFDRLRTVATTLEGYDTEFGVLLPGRFAADRQIRAFGGAYYYDTGAEDSIGWKASLRAQPLSWLEAGFQVANDSFFDTTTSFNVAVSFGGYRENGPRQNSRYRMAEPVRRNLTIATAEVGELDVGVPVTDAAGANISITHVSSLTGRVGALGTATDPFATIQQAQATGSDIIFVHAGSSYDVASANTVALASGTRVLGEGLISNRLTPAPTEHLISVADLGSIALPASPSFAANDQLGRPVLDGALGNGVTLADDAEFSGFVVQNSVMDGVFGSDIDSAVLNQNLITQTGGAGVRLLNPTGTFGLTDTIIDSTIGDAFNVDGGGANIVFSQTDSSANPGIGGIVNSSGHAVSVSNTTGGSVNFTSATIDETGGDGILIENSAGAVVIDNLAIAGTTGPGISIQNSSGDIRFLSTIRGFTTLDQTTGSAIDIGGLDASGSVGFFAPVEITQRQSSGVTLTGNAGEIEFLSDVTVGGTSADTGISIANNLATSSIRFRNGAVVDQGAGIGIEITGGEFDVAANQRALVQFAGPVLLDGLVGDSLVISGDNSAALFSGVTVSNRGSRGVVLTGANGIVAFSGATTVDNELDSLVSAIDISGSQGQIGFGQTQVINAQGPVAAVSVVGNTAGADGNAEISFGNLDIDHSSAFGLGIQDSDHVVVGSGTIVSTGGTSVSAFTSGTDLEWVSIDNDGGPNSIVLVDTFEPSDPTGLSSFVVNGDPSAVGAGSGGVLENNVGSAVFASNGGDISLNGIVFDDNDTALNIAYTGLPDPPEAEVIVTNSDILDNNSFGLVGLNIPNLTVEDVNFDNNGDDGTTGAESILLQYDETPNDPELNEPDDYDDPYSIVLNRITVVDNSDDAVIIQALPGAADAHLNLEVGNSVFTATGLDGDGGRGVSALDEINDSAFAIRWDGPMRVQVGTSTFNITSGVEDNQIGFDLVNDSRTDFSEILFNQNRINSVSDLDITTNERDTGLIIDLEGESETTISSNTILAAGTDFTGMQLEFDEAGEVQILNNVIDANIGRAEGIIIDRLTEPSSLTFEGNSVGVAGIGSIQEIGVSIRAIGVIDLFGNTNNEVFTIGNGQTFNFTGSTPDGQILINGAPRP